MVIPADIIKTITVPVQWAVASALSPAPAVSPVTAPAVINPAMIPVEYVFPEMVIPADIIKTITVPVQWAAASALSPAPAVSPVTAPAAINPARVPVEYVFPEMVIPADIIKTITVPVEWAVASALPPRRAGPLPSASGLLVNGSVGQGVTPPEPPMTQAEQIIYSRMDYYENVKIEVSPEDGASARIVRPPRSPRVALTISGGA